MDPFFIVFLVVVVIGGFIYKADRAGWHATAKRLSRMVRASIESSKPVKEITAKVETHAVESWERDFKAIEKPQAAQVALVEPRNQKHVIVKRVYQKVSTGEIWPYVYCKCGWKGRNPTGIWSEAETLSRTARQGEAHVKSQNEAEEKLAKSKGNFAW